MTTKDMQLSVLILKEVKIGRRKLSNMPFVLDSNGYPHREINEYLLDNETLLMKRDIEQTVTPKARQIVSVYNALLKLVTQEKEFRPYAPSSEANDDQSLSRAYLHGFWLSVNQQMLQMIQQNMKMRGDVMNNTINTHISVFCHFLFWAEHDRGLCEGLIGVNDLLGRSDVSYRIPVKKPQHKSKAKFSITWSLESDGTAPKPKGMIKRHDNAYKELMTKGDDEKSMILGMRDLLILRVMREAALRREETATLDASEFCQENPIFSDRGDYIYCRTSATKGVRDLRRFLCPVDLYFDIQNFAESFRLELVPETVYKQKGYKPSTKLFLSTTTGTNLQPGSINGILKPYNINPHSSRKVAITEIAMGLIELKYSKTECLFILSEIAGHSIKSEGKTIEQHYLLAQDMLKESPPNSVSLRYKLDKAELRIAALEKQLDKQS
ncbi:site-specific integrase [Vibrio breoganii]|uniref:site-specific integrase n=1 Tax=Vibrio breoganii TaxID=553239 RepID=UPI000C8462B5|nr:site-specific integrase [Vibrio breoganii]PMG89965.1 hypothetical protein BCU79_18215 [Vibrio breoganii]PMJ48019.1 hypothetical protein BCU21_04905 [Vibrio breoganii]PMK57707.1 hypothetical protein BCT97_09960 [Vibrio breoganii]PMM79569.1 hypothetical protein BCT44_15010 [Vibrio breoganii]PMO27171.1 hypothetical protein BCT14_13470 [Vibrio breoganii]